MDPTTIGQYIARFRHGKPLPRDKRATLNKEFWWIDQTSSDVHFGQQTTEKTIAKDDQEADEDDSDDDDDEEEEEAKVEEEEEEEHKEQVDQVESDSESSALNASFASSYSSLASLGQIAQVDQPPLDAIPHDPFAPDQVPLGVLTSTTTAATAVDAADAATAVTGGSSPATPKPQPIFGSLRSPCPEPEHPMDRTRTLPASSDDLNSNSSISQWNSSLPSLELQQDLDFQSDPSLLSVENGSSHHELPPLVEDPEEVIQRVRRRLGVATPTTRSPTINTNVYWTPSFTMPSFLSPLQVPTTVQMQPQGSTHGGSYHINQSPIVPGSVTSPSSANRFTFTERPDHASEFVVAAEPLSSQEPLLMSATSLMVHDDQHGRLDQEALGLAASGPELPTSSQDLLTLRVESASKTFHENADRVQPAGDGAVDTPEPVTMTRQDLSEDQTLGLSPNVVIPVTTDECIEVNEPEHEQDESLDSPVVKACESPNKAVAPDPDELMLEPHLEVPVVTETTREREQEINNEPVEVVDPSETFREVVELTPREPAPLEELDGLVSLVVQSWSETECYQKQITSCTNDAMEHDVSATATAASTSAPASQTQHEPAAPVDEAEQEAVTEGATDHQSTTICVQIQQNPMTDASCHEKNEHHQLDVSLVPEPAPLVQENEFAHDRLQQQQDTPELGVTKEPLLTPCSSKNSHALESPHVVDSDDSDDDNDDVFDDEICQMLVDRIRLLEQALQSLDNGEPSKPSRLKNETCRMENSSGCDVEHVVDDLETQAANL